MAEVREAWVVAAESGEVTVRFEAPVEIEGWEERPWVEVRALTDAETLEREAIGLWEEYELVSEGLGEAQVRVTRRYDLPAMAEYDYAHGVVDFCLPEMTAAGEVRPRRGSEIEASERAELLGRMQPCLSQWVWRAIETINHRTPEQRCEIEMVKKN
jgi:hypothetical protein